MSVEQILASEEVLPWYTGAAAFSATLAGAWGFTRLIYGTAMGRLNGRVDGLMEKLERTVRESMAGPP